ncbi:hypothetical protein ADK60_12950 [Streptomyces sp. XY431]|uniref:hypothetical protein n=1 Tax=Streptomyces sp. XY431 TaxID=1415562 RepID=UPI0006ADAEB3|nr:hypothetical protein [Streptomyces sp. XY431]KOV33066.1 hypothetical protein ADK60_12950 [Streptomyces sp. XY431]
MARRFNGVLRRAGLTAAAAATILMASAGVASAATGEGYASGPGVFGSANWEWTKSGWKNGKAAVRDTRCENPLNYGVYIHFNVKANGKTFTTKDRFDPDGCGGSDGYWSGLTYDAGFYVTSVQVETCVDDWGDDTCFTSAWQDNPLT